MVNVLVSAYAPYKTLCVALDAETELSTLPALLAARTRATPSEQSLTLSSGRTLPSEGCLSQISQGQDVHLRLALKLPGGKGGFGSQLRAAGGRMSSRGREQNTDSCRDLSGRRLSSVKEAQRVAQYVEGAEERERQRKEAQARRLEELNGQVNKLQGGSGKKRRDREPEEDEDKSEERREKGKSAIMAAMLKKRKKNTSPPAPAAAATDSSNSSDSKSESEQAASTPSPDATSNKSDPAEATTESSTKTK